MTPRPPKRPSIRDIAEAAGVSITTVSHALNDKGRVNPATRARVVAAAERLGYSANLHAQRLASGRHRTLAVQVSGVGGVLVPASTYYLDLLNGAADAAAERDYTLVLAASGMAESPRPLHVDGAIVVDPAGGEPLVERLLDDGIAVVTTGRVLGRDEVPWVDNDHRAATIRGLEHLRRRGYDRPALLTTDPRRSYTADIVAGYEAWCAQHGVPPAISRVADPPTEAAAARATRRLLRFRPRPNAIYASLDVVALGALRLLQADGVAVPAEVALMSAVEGEALRWTSPSISGVGLYPERVGAAAAELLIAWVEDGERPRGGDGGRVPTRIIARSSTAASGARAGADGRVDGSPALG